MKLNSMVEMKRLSVIVPMYKVEEYVERCIRSLEEQDIPTNEYEIICINDGSPDNCKEVVLVLMKEFDNIVLIDKENQGVSRARNDGIDKATGKYLLFIDPDDYVEINSLGRILQTADEYKAEVSFLGFTFLNEDGTLRTQVFYRDDRSDIYNGMEAYTLSRGDGRTDPDRMVAVLFDQEFINQNNLRYLPDVPFLEDGEFIARILCLAKRCIFDGNSFYMRTTRPGSATNSNLFHTDKATNGFILAAVNLRTFKLEQNLTEDQRVFLNQPIVKFVLLAIQSSIGWSRYKRFKITKRKLKKASLGKLDLRACNKQYYQYGKIYNISPFLSGLALILFPRFQRLYEMIIEK